MRRFVTGMPKGRFTPAEGPATLCGVFVETDDATGPRAPRRAGAGRRPACPGRTYGRSRLMRPRLGALGRRLGASAKKI